MGEEKNVVVAAKIINITGAKISVGGKIIFPQLGEPFQTKTGGIAQFPLNFWAIAKKSDPDEKGFRTYLKDKKGRILLDENICPKENGTLYIINETEEKLFFGREDYVLFIPEKTINWKTFKGGTLEGILGRKVVIIEEVAIELEEDTPEEEEISEGLGSLSEALKDVVVEEDETIIEEETVEEKP